MATRRHLLELAAAAVGGLLSLGHTPYRQWQVYRQSRVIVLASAEDEAGVALADAVVAVLAEHLPESRATVARARDTLEVVKLLASRQLDIALLAAADATAAAAGNGRFAEAGPVALGQIARIGSHVLVCRNEVPADRVHDLARTLAQHGGALPRPVDGAAVVVAPLLLHPGARDYYQGRPPRP